MSVAVGIWFGQLQKSCLTRRAHPVLTTIPSRQSPKYAIDVALEGSRPPDAITKTLSLSHGSKEDGVAKTSKKDIRGLKETWRPLQQWNGK
ncbi:hypothetical protein V6N12_058444 [Hibiscus sabdariffa]|uniref:Uncharacterized protein n=1 Tax=Hibiscus sabdariffa TaxID=183260 RepID=A0ABR2ES61_9ROSI